MRKTFLRICGLTLLLTGCPGSEDTPRIHPQQRDSVSFEGVRFDTSEGPFTAILYPEAAPETVARYLEYVDSGYYVGRSFDRVVPGFVIQATDCAISVLTRDTRTLPLEVTEDHFFGAGALGIARSSDPNSGGSEFFVMDFAAGHLGGDYTVWGQVVDGLDVIRRAARVQAIDFTAGGQAPALAGDRCAVEPVEITATARVTVELSPREAARYPLKTAERVRTDSASYNLEWPASLAVGSETALTAYIRSNNGTTPVPAPESVGIVIDGAAPITVTGDPTADGIYHFNWTPLAEGEHEVVIRVDGADVATLYLYTD
jgi:peptidyl-prolyl cis-trans isomerase A (cyclophilin A)